MRGSSGRRGYESCTTKMVIGLVIELVVELAIEFGDQN